MEKLKTVKDIMVGIFDYPHVPYWFSIEQTIRIIKASFAGAKQNPVPMAVLVFDEKYNLLGTVLLTDILKGVEPGFLKPVERAQIPETDASSLSLVWDSFFAKGSKELAEKSVSDIMTKVKYFVEPGDSVTKAAYIMLHNDFTLLPVLENKRKFVGLVRMIEVFDAISEGILKG